MSAYTAPQMSIAQAQAGGHKPFGLPVVVLAERDKQDMDQEVSGNRLPCARRFTPA